MRPAWIFAALLALVSLVAFLLYGLDKRRARRGAWRIKESVLLSFGFFGGAIGALLGMRTFRHKTRHLRFYFVNVLGLLWQVSFFVYLLVC